MMANKNISKFFYMDYSNEIEDIKEGFQGWRIWARFGWQDIRRKYKRTKIGPFWLSLQLGISILSIGIVWSVIFHQSTTTYIPYLASGMIVWGLLTSIIIEGSKIFIETSTIIISRKISKTLLVLQVIWRNLLTFMHNIVVFIIIVIICDVPVNSNTLLVFPGLLIIALNGVWLSLLLGILCARYRDIEQIITSMIQILMYITPVLWSESSLSGHSVALFFVSLNPLYYAVNVLREPLLGRSPALSSWIAMIVIFVVGSAITLKLFRIYRPRIAYWL